MFELSKEEEERAKDLHNEAIIFDGAVSSNYFVPFDLKYFTHLQIGGLTSLNTTVALFLHDFKRAVNSITKFKKCFDKNSDKMLLVRTVEDIERAKEEGKVGVVMGFQDGKPIEDDLGYLDAFYDMGVRIVQLTYNAQNFIGIGCCELNVGGLTYFGREVIDRMNEIGMVLDLSHCCDETTEEAIERSKDPVVFSHANVRAICNAYGRNKTDKQIKSIAEKGGLIGITLFPALVKRDPRTFQIQKSTINDVLDHIDHVVRLTGVNHVGLGSDMGDKSLDQKFPPASATQGGSVWCRLKGRYDVFGRGSTDVYDPFPEGLDRHTKLSNLTRGLVSRDYSDEDIKKILGGNFLRVFKKVWK